MVTAAPAAPTLEQLAEQLDQPFTFDMLVRAAEVRHLPVSDLMGRLRDAERDSVVVATGDRRSSPNALRGARLYRLA